MVLTNAPWKYVWSYLTNLCQRTKIDTAYNSWTEIIKEVPQESILGPILFDIFLSNPQANISLWKNETFVAMPMIQIHYSYDQNLDQLINRLERDCFLSIGWFASNYMKLDTEKYQLLISENKKIGNYVGEDKI